MRQPQLPSNGPVPQEATFARLQLGEVDDELVTNLYPTAHGLIGGSEPLPEGDPSPCGLGTGATAGTIVAVFG